MDDTSRRVDETDGLDDDAHRRATRLRSDINETREELNETVAAIQEKLRPANIVANATDQVKRATTERVRHMAHSAGETTRGVMSQTRRTADNLMYQVRRRPVSAALVGLGAAWLLTKASRRRGNGLSAYDSPRFQPDERWIDDEAAEYGILERLSDNPIPAALCGVGLTWLATSGREPAMRRQNQDWRQDEDYGSWDAESSVADTARRAGERAQQYAAETTAAVRGATRRAQNGLQRVINENPLMAGAGALILGAAIGLSLPESERENEWMGEARENLVERAQDVARNAVSTVQEAAGDMAGEVVKRAMGGDET